MDTRPPTSPVTPRPSRVTSADVARRAGVSRATVSYVLNDTPGQPISSGTRDRVLTAARELGYAPSIAGRALVSGRSDVVVLTLPDAPLNEMTLRIMQALTRELDALGLTLSVHVDTQGGGGPARLATMFAARALVALLPPPDDEVRALAAHGVPLIVLTDGAPLLQPVGRAQVHHLAERGRRRLAYARIDVPRLDGFAQPRLEGVRAACAELGLPEPIDLIVPGDPERAEAAVRALLAEHEDLDGVAAYNDEIALVVLHGLRRCGVPVPGRVAVVGVDDVAAAPYAEPPLSSVVLDAHHVAAGLCARVTATVTGELGSIPPSSPPRVVQRASS